MISYTTEKDQKKKEYYIFQAHVPKYVELRKLHLYSTIVHCSWMKSVALSVTGFCQLT